MLINMIMKTLILLFTSCLILFTSVGCNKKPISLNEPQEVIITGQVINKRHSDPNSIVVIIDDIATGERIQYLGDLDETGNFEIRFERYYPHDVLLKYNFIWSVFVHPGDSIHIELDTEKTGSDEDIYHALAFSGDAVKENEELSYINGWYSKIRKNEPVLEANSYSPDTYKLYRDSLRTIYHNEAIDLIKVRNISEPIKSWIYYEIEYYYFHNLVMYPMIQRRLKNYPTNWNVPTSYYGFFEETNFNSELILNSGFAKSFISYFYTFYVHNNIRQELIPQGMVKDTMFADGRTAQSWKVENIDSVFIEGINRFTPKEIKQFVLYNYFVGKQKHQSDIKTYEKYLPLINNEITEPFLLSNLQKNYTENKKFEKTLTKTDRKNVIESNNNTGTNLLKGIISDNEGKVIYIVYWSISCGISLKEMANSKKLMSELNNENIEFVFLCRNSTEDEARKKLDDLKIAGTHYFLDADQTNYIQKELNFSSYPNFTLIDKNGQIVSSNFKYRPGYPETKKKILELVNE